ncbi:MAG: transcriptional regulator TrmB [Parcubacteria group bacterium Gr01-1014_33]|nr:MAG: transcriptional regulator TrmB [Parcubacteria group bacterium Gr01-1014_33]
MNPQQIVEQLGLTQKEAAIYLATLELGQAPVLRIAQKAGVKRPTAYITLSSLHEKGLIDIIPKRATTFYRATDPDLLLEKFNEKVGKFKSLLPELKAISNSSPNKPKVKFYEGKTSILSLYEKEIFNRHEILALVSIKELIRVLSAKELNDLVHIMKATGTHIREFVEKSSEAEEYLKEKNRLALGETKFLTPELHFNIDILVYENTVAMISPKTVIAVLIEDIAIANAQRQFLEFLWKSL